MKKSLFKWFPISALVMGILLLILTGVTGATGSSTTSTFTYQGYIELRRRPVNDVCDFQFSLWDAASSGSQIGTTQTHTISVSEGVFMAELDFGSGAFPGDPRWLGIAVVCPSGGGSYTTLSPRQPLNAVPYASFAHASSWSGLSGVPAGLSDGDDDTTYTAGTGLNLSGTEFSVNNVPWSALVSVPSGLDDGDDDTTYTAGTGLNLTGSEFSVNNVPWSALASVPSGLDDGDDDTTYTAGTGLNLTGSEFSVNNVPWSALASVPSGLDDGDNDTLSGLSCSTDQIAKWNGTAWACAADDSGGGGVPAGAGILSNSQTPPTGYTYSNSQVQLAGTGTWVLKQRRTTRVDYQTASVVNGKIYAIGGEIDWDVMSDITEEYDPATNTWTTRAPMPTARTNLASATTGGLIYVVGGEDLSTELTTLEEYNPATNSWATRAPMPTARRQLGAAAVGGKVYAIGGTDGTRMATVEEYDPATNTWATKTPMPTARYDLAVVALDGKIYAIGGYGDGEYSDAVEVYDPATDTWTTGASLPYGSYRARAAALAGKIYVPKDGLVYDPSTDTWAFMDSFYTSGGPAVVAGGSLYVVSGAMLQQYVPATYWYLHTKD